MRLLFLGLVLATALVGAGTAAAVDAVVGATGTSFYDLPFPHELRRDPDGTISVARFPFPPDNEIVASYAAAFEQLRGFGISSGVFLKFTGDLDPATLPASTEASRAPGASVFLVDIDPASPAHGTRIPLWFEFRSAGDDFRDPHLLAFMPVPGHRLAENTLYAAVVTDAVRDPAGSPVGTPAAIQRLAAETPAGPFEQAAMPLYRLLWTHLET